MTTNGWASRTIPGPGSRAAIVGGCGGIGRAIVAACRELGLRTAVLDLPQSIEKHPVDVELLVPMDATSAPNVEAAFKQVAATFDGLDILVFVVGFTLTPPRPTTDIDEPQWSEVVNGNLTSAHLVIRRALPLLRRGNQPNIVTISSGLGVSVLRGFGPYAAAKAGLIALTKTVALEGAPELRANAVAPSAILTDFMTGGLGRHDSDGRWFDPSPYIPLIPLQRLADVDDVVGAVLFLASPAAGFITGQTIHVNGGRFMP
jgi:3-oxoacyl-[acyl-carrier protein] reductase